MLTVQFFATLGHKSAIFKMSDYCPFLNKLEIIIFNNLKRNKKIINKYKKGLFIQHILIDLLLNIYIICKKKV